MSLIRPELRAALWRWRESLAGLALAALGLWAAWRGFGALALLGWGLVLGGLALALSGIPRARFRRGGEGPGVVQVVERQIGYFGPQEGGTMALDAMAELRFARGRWLLTDREGNRLTIPAEAKGAEALFDAFAALPGLDPARLVRPETAGGRPLWQRTTRPALTSPPAAHRSDRGNLH